MHEYVREAGALEELGRAACGRALECLHEQMRTLEAGAMDASQQARALPRGALRGHEEALVRTLAREQLGVSTPSRCQPVQTTTLLRQRWAPPPGEREYAAWVESSRTHSGGALSLPFE
jgi:hypothetical protein